jgi:DinB superfamily
VAWHRQYERPGPLSRRLDIVRGHVERLAAERGAAPIRVLSLCSGDGRDLVEPLARIAVQDQVSGRLVEADETLAGAARRAIGAAGLDGLEVVEGDAGTTTSLEGAVPADLVLLCGIFGNVSDDDIRTTVLALPVLCAEGAAVIWTRHRREPDLTPTIRAWFAEAGFEHEAFQPVADSTGAVGVERFAGIPKAFAPGVRLFEFIQRPANWLDRLEAGAPDVVAAYRNVEAGRFITVRREVRRRTHPGTASSVARQLAAIADELDILIANLADDAFAAPGGEGDWNVAQAIGHTAHARAGLSLAGALAASGRWPADAPAVVPGIPGAPAATRDELRRRIGLSQRAIERAARTIEGHETEPCPLLHPLVGRLRCGEWLLFAGVHDLMHLEQLQRIDSELAGSAGEIAAPVAAAGPTR